MVMAIAAGACTQSTDHPPGLADCTGVDAACPPPEIAGGGGGGSGSDGGATVTGCTVNAADSQCDQCGNGSCCNDVDNCQNDMNCRTLLICEESCGGGPTCVSTCEGLSPLGVDLLTTLDDCLQVKCPVCLQFGVGDPCDPAASACNPGLACDRSWCSKPCVRASDCVGLGANGGNELNLPNACMEITGLGQVCAPGCSVDSDCIDFPSTYCSASTSIDGLVVTVCLPLADAGASD
jgi:hypothetical protein